MKKLLALLLAVMLVISGLGPFDGPAACADGTSGGQAEESAAPQDQPQPDGSSSDGWLYRAGPDGNAVITGYGDTAATVLSVPKTLGSKPVTAIDGGAFRDLDSLRQITIPARVVSLGGSLFSPEANPSIQAYHGSAALSYAISNGIRHQTIGADYDFQTGVIDLSGEAGDVVISGSSLVMPAAMADMLKAGDVFFYPAQDARRLNVRVGHVLSVQVNGKNAVAAFEEGNIFNAVNELSADSADLPVSAEIRWNPDVVEDASQQWEKVLIDKKDSKSKTLPESKRLNLKGGSYIEAGFSLGFNLKYHIYASASGKGLAVWTYRLNAEIKQFELTFNVTPYVKGEINLVNYDSGRKKLADVIFYSDGVFSVSAGLYAQITVSGKISFYIEQVNTLTMTWNRSKNSFDTSANSYTSRKELRIDANIDVKIIPQLAISIVGIKVLTGDYIIHFDFDASLTVRRLQPLATCVNLKLQMHHSITVSFGLLSGPYTKTLLSKTFNLFSKTIFNIHMEDWKIVNGCTRGSKSVKFNTNGGTSLNPLPNVAWGTNIYVSTPSKSGYTFDGWYTDSALRNRFTNPVYTDLTLFAKWKSNVTPKPNQGIPSGDITPKPDDSTPTPYNPGPGPDPVTPAPATATPTPTPAPILPTSVQLDKTAVTLYTDTKDTTAQLTATVSPANATNKDVYWESSDPKIAHVDDKGKITAIKAGTATITCAAAGKTSVRATCTVTVKQRVTGIALSSGGNSVYMLELLKGDTATLSAAVLPTDASNKKLTWSSSDTAVATVSDAGVVKAVNHGTATITATAADGLGTKAECTVYVENQLEVNANAVNTIFYTSGEAKGVIGYVIPTSNAMLRMQKAGNKLTYTLKRTGDGASSAELSLFETVTEVKGESVTAQCAALQLTEMKGTGSDTYTVTCTAGQYTETAVFKVKVSGSAGEYAEKATLSETTFTKKAGETITIPNTPTALGSGKIPSGMSMTIIGHGNFDRKATCKKTSSGATVTFSEPGDYTASVEYSVANVSYTIELTFYITDEQGKRHLPVESVEIGNGGTLVIGKELQLTPKVLPSDAYNKTLVWTSSDPKVAEVSSAGKVTAKAAGFCVITATAADGSEHSDSATIFVQKNLQLMEESTTVTIYLRGESNVWVDGVQLTAESVERLIAAGKHAAWSLKRLSGDCTEIALSENEWEDGLIQGNQIHVLRINKTGTDIFRVTCTDGTETTSALLNLKVVDTKLPSEITLAETEYTADKDAVFEISTEPAGTADAKLLPKDRTVHVEAPTHFWDHCTLEYGTENGHVFCIDQAGSYQVQVVFSGSNYSYTVPVTLNIRDASGKIPILPSGLKLDTGRIDLLAGKTKQLKPTVTPSNADDQGISWTSEDTSVATVSSSGLVTAVKAGSTFIRATANGSGVTAYCIVNVEDGLTLEPFNTAQTVYLEGLTRCKLVHADLTELSCQGLKKAPEWTLKRVSGTSLTLRLNPTETTNENGATVYGCDLILYTVSKTGQTTYDLTCTSGQGSETVRITVNSVSRNDNMPAAVTLHQSEYTADLNKLIVVKPELVVSPASASLPNDVRISCVMDDQMLAALNQEDFYYSRALSTFSFSVPGTYHAVFSYAHSNLVYNVPVTFRIRDEKGEVPIQGSRVTLSRNDIQLTPGNTAKLEPVFTPVDATNQAVTWSSSDTSVATVSATGTVKAVSNGTAVITCTPKDTRCMPVTATVTVEEWFTIEAGADEYSYYIQGKQENTLFVANLTAGTWGRLQEAGLTPEWTLTRKSGSGADVEMTVAQNRQSAAVETTALTSGGTTRYSIQCKAGTHSWSKEFSIVTTGLGGTVPASVTLATPVQTLNVGESVTVDFAPVCEPSGTSVPDGMMTMFIGVGGFYDALDRNVYKTSGTKATVAFTKAGSYLLTRAYMLDNLTYTAVCQFNVGNVKSPKLLSASNTEYTVYINGKSAEAATVTLTDTTFYELMGSDLSWDLKKISGNSVRAGLKAEGQKATLLALETLDEGTDVWRVSCNYGKQTVYQDITIHVVLPRKMLPQDITLAVDKAEGVIGGTIAIPLGANCKPEESTLPDTGDDFWSFRMVEGMGEYVSEYRIENNMLLVTFRESGYYTGLLRYASGNISFEKPVYFTVHDEEDVVAAPKNLSVFILNGASVVYPEGEKNVVIATAAISENANSYYNGMAEAYAKMKGTTWKLERTSGTAATLAIKETSPGRAAIRLTSTSGTGTVVYTVSCTIGGKTYSAKYQLKVAGKSDTRPDPTLRHNSYTVTVGENVVIDSQMYNGTSGAVLQSAAEWNNLSAAGAMNNHYDTYDDTWMATFYEPGTYNTTVSTYVGNLRYEMPLVIRVVEGKVTKTKWTVKLPKQLKTLEEEAFADMAITLVDARGTNLEKIGSGAFRGCTELTAVYLPDTVKSIAADAFSGCRDLVVHCTKGSYAETWAKGKGLKVSYDMK